MNTFFSLERFTRLSVPLRLFRVLVWTLLAGGLCAGAAGQAQAQTIAQSTEYPPEYYWQQPITGFRNGNDPAQIVYAIYAYGNKGRTTSTDPDSLQFLNNITLLRNGIQLTPAEASLVVVTVNSIDPASKVSSIDQWNPYGYQKSNQLIQLSGGSSATFGYRTADYGCYNSYYPENGNRGNPRLCFISDTYDLNKSRNVWSITFTLAKPDTASAVYTIRMRDKYGRFLDSNVTQVGVIPQGSAATFAVVKQPVNASVSSGSLMAFSVDPQNHVLGLLNTPFGVTSDADGNIFIADTLNNAIRKISVGGRMTTLAGLDGQALDFVHGTTAMILGGSLLNGTRQLTAGTITVINRDRAPQAGSRDGTSDQRTGDGTTNPNTYRYDTDISTGVSNTAGNGPTSSEPLFNNPQGIVVADNGMLFVADTNNNAIRSITVNTGTGTGTAVVKTLRDTTDPLNTVDINLNKPRAIALTGSLANYDDANPPSLWVVDSNNYRIQQITLKSDGTALRPVIIAGIGMTPGWSAGTVVTNLTQNFLSPSGLVVSSDELTIYVADTANHVIRRLQRAVKPPGDSPVWNAVTLAGAVGFKGNVNARGTDARLSFPTGLALDETNGFLYFTEYGNHGVRRLILPGGNSAQPYVQGGTLGAGLRYELQVEAIAGGGRPLPNPIDGTTGEGTGANASFNYPAGITFNKLDGSLILADSNNHVIRKITYLTNLVNNLDPDGSYNQLNTQSKTVEKVIVDRLGSVFSNGTVKAIDDKLVGNSVTLTGVATYAGNHDYAELNEYPNYEWLFWGEPIGYSLDYGTSASQYTGDGTTDLEIQSANYENVGPYQVNITNYWGVGNSSSEVSGYVALGEQPRFLAPGYALFDYVGKRILNFGTLAGGSFAVGNGQIAVGTQLSTYPDRTAKPLQLGDRVSLNALILPGDEVTYQWQVTAESLRAVGGYGGGLGGSVEDYPWVNLTDAQTDVQTAGVSLQGQGSLFSGSLVGAGSLCVRDLLGTKGELGISRLSGTTTATLNIEHFQQSFYGKVPPQLRFRVKAYKKGMPQVDAGTSATSLDTKTVVLVNPDTFTETLVDTTVLNTGTVNDEDRTNGLLLSPNFPPVISDTQLLVNGSPASAAASVADYFVSSGTVSTLTLSGIVSASPQATYQWYYLAPQKASDPTAAVAITGANGTVILSTAGTVTLSGSLSTTGTLSAGGTLPAGIYYVAIDNGVAKVESQRVNLQISPPVLANELPVRGTSFTFAPQATSSDANLRIISMGTSQGVQGTMSAVFESLQPPKFTWTFTPTFPSGSSPIALVDAGTYASISTSPVSIGTSTAGNLYRATFSGSLGTTASGTYTLVATAGTLTVAVKWPVAMQYSPRYVPNSKLATLTSGGTTASYPNAQGSQLPQLALSTPKTVTLSGSFSCAPGLDTQYVWRRNNRTVKSGTLSPSDSGPLAVPSLGPIALQESDLGIYTLTVLNSEGIGQVVEAGAAGWQVLATGEPYLGNGGKPGINAVTDVSKTTNASTSLSGTLSSATDHSAVGSVSAETYSSSAVIPRYVTAGQSAVLQFTVNADPAPNAYQWTYRSAVDGTPAAISSKTAFKTPSATEKVTLASGTSAMLSIRVPATATAGTHGFYQLTATNTKGSVLSPTVQLIVNPVPVPVVTVTPAGTSSSSVTIVKGGSLTLAVSSLSATGVYSYQWKRNGVDIASGTIGTQSTLKITNARTAQTGKYTVVVTDTQTQTTRESAGVSVTVSGTDSSKEAQLITFENTTKLRMFMCSASLSAADLDGNVTAKVVPGTKVSWVSVVPANQMLQCWRATGATSQSVTILPGSTASFLMPDEAVTIEAVLSRPYSSMYSGFLTLEKPWVSEGNYEWTSRDEAGSGNRLESPELNSLRGYYTCTLTSTGLISGKITLEDKLYPFVATLAPDMSATFQITLKMSDGNPWRMNGSLAFNPTQENEQADYADNSLHVTLTDALLKTPPLLNSSQTLYCRAIGSAGPSKSLSIVNPVTGLIAHQNVSGALATLLDGIAVPGAISAPPNLAVSYTAAVFRLNSTTGLTSKSSFGQGGVFTVSVGGTTGGAIVTGLYGNGTQFTFSGQLLQANYDAPSDASPFISTASDLSVKARDVMTEAMLGNSASVVLPIFGKGDKATEPVFGACIFSAANGADTNTLYGALGALSAGVNLTNTSEYTANYVGGYVFDPTLKPFTSVASSAVSAGTLAPTVTMFTTEAYSFTNPLAKWVNGVSQLTSWGTLPITNGSKTFGWTGGAASPANTGNFTTLTYLESTNRYVYLDNKTNVYPEFAKWYDAVNVPVGYKGKAYLQSGIAGVMFCGAAPGGVQPIFQSMKPPYGIGFFLRGLSTGASQYSGNTPQTLRDTLGNGLVEEVTLKGFTTHRSEGVIITIDDPY